MFMDWFTSYRFIVSPHRHLGNCSSTIAPALFYYLPSMAVCVTLIPYILVGHWLLVAYDHHGWWKCRYCRSKYLSVHPVLSHTAIRGSLWHTVHPVHKKPFNDNHYH